MAWFITVCILSYKTTRITIHFSTCLRQSEVLVELLDKRLHTTKEIDKSLRVLRDEPHVLPSITLNEAWILVTEGVERLNPVAFIVFRLEETRSRVEEVAIVFAAFDETFVVGSLSEFLRNCSHAPIVEGLFHRDGYADVLLVLRHVAILFPNLERTVGMSASAALDHSLVGSLDVKSRQFRHDGIGHNGYGVIAYHTIIVLSPKVPNGQVTVGFVMKNHVSNKLYRNIGIKKGVERMGCTEGIPKAERAVIALTCRHLLDFEVGIHVSSIHITDGVGLHEDMIEACIEDSLLVVCALDVDSGEFLFPSIMSGFGVVVEVPRLRFCLHILASSIIINCRDGDFCQHIFLIIRETEGSPQCATVYDITFAGITSAIHQDATLKGTREFDAEINLSQLCPTSQDTEAFDSLVIEDAYLTLDYLISATSCIIGITTESHTVEVENNGLFFAFWKQVLVDTYMSCCGKFDVYVLAAKQVNHIVTWSRLFLFMLERQSEDAFAQQFGCDTLYSRHQGDVDEVCATCSAEVGMREAENGVAVVVVAATRVPSDVLLSFWS